MDVNLENDEVTTTLNHRRFNHTTQLVRDVSDLIDLEEIFTNPRVHTNRGRHIRGQRDAVGVSSQGGRRQERITSYSPPLHNEEDFLKSNTNVPRQDFISDLQQTYQLILLQKKHRRQEHQEVQLNNQQRLQKHRELLLLPEMEYHKSGNLYFSLC